MLEPGASAPASSATKPGDTAIALPIGGDDDLIELGEDQEATGMNPPVAKEAEATVEISEDAVADYLLNIELDDDDQP